MSNKATSIGLLIAATLLATPAALTKVQAADLDSVYGGLEPIAEQKVEYGSGWYVRGDIAAARNPAVTALPSSSGLAPAISFEPNRTFGYTASLGAGYAFTKWFRADAIFDFHQPIQSSFNSSPFSCINGYGITPAVASTTSLENGNTVTTPGSPASSYYTYGSCTGQYKAALKSYDVLANGYLDIGTWYRFTPYVGAGLGLSFGHYQTASTFTQADTSSYNISITDPVSGSAYHIFLDRRASGQYYNLAYALMAGVAIDVFDHTKLDIGYRYLNLGRVLNNNVYTSEARAGLRYMIDN